MTFANNPRRALAVLILGTFVVRVLWAALVGTGNDEAYNFLYTVYPAWSYFDHPPMTMWISKVGLFVFGGWVDLLSLRSGYLLLFAGSTWALFRLTSRWYGEWAGFYAALALNLSAFYTAAAGAFALPDGPFLFFTLLTFWALSEALVGSPERVRPWVWVGLAWAGALVSKYHAVLLPAGALLYIVVTPSARRLLRSPGPYLATAIGLLGFAPVVLWNTQNGWASFAFQGGRALEWKFRWSGPLVVMLGTMAFLLPWIWLALAKTVVVRLRGPALANIDRLLLCLASVPLAFFLVLSCGRGILMHWPLVGFVPLFCLLGQRWAVLAEAQPIRMRRHVTGMAFGVMAAALLVLAQARFGVVSFPSRDPCWEFSGWDSIGAELQARGLMDQPNTFLFTSCWDDSGQLAFSVRNRAPVLCYNTGDARGFAFWSRPEDWVGKDGLFVSLDDNAYAPVQFQAYFQSIELVADFQMIRGGNPFRHVRVFRCTHQVQPFPFTYTRVTSSRA